MSTQNIYFCGEIRKERFIHILLISSYDTQIFSSDVSILFQTVQPVFHCQVFQKLSPAICPLTVYIWTAV